MTGTTSVLDVDVHRLYDLTGRLLDALPDITVTVRVTGPAELGSCEECPNGEDDAEIPAQAVVRHGYSRVCYSTDVCEQHLVAVVLRHLRHDQARPVVDIPSVLL